jgi:hypothetical protein
MKQYDNTEKLFALSSAGMIRARNLMPEHEIRRKQRNMGSQKAEIRKVREWILINAGKSISSSWRVRNGRQFVNRWQQRKRSGRRWQNTVRGRKYLYSGRQKETELIDEKIRAEAVNVKTNNWLKMHGYPMHRKEMCERKKGGTKVGGSII